MVKERDSRIEVLRIISMIMILAHHLVLYGVKEYYAPEIANIVYNSGTLINKCVASLLFPDGVVGVAIFFMIAGYFGIQSNKTNYMKLVEPVVFYSILGTVIGVLLTNDVENLKQILINGIFLLECEVYWFASVYVLLMLIKPAINDGLKSLSKRQMVILMVGMIGQYALLRYVGAAYLGLINGLVFYIIGAVIKMNEHIIKTHPIIFLLLGMVGWIGYSVLDVLPLSGFLGTVTNLVAVCVCGTISAIGFFCLCLKVKPISNKVINSIAATTFGVYLIHEHPLMREVIWRKLLCVSTVQWESDRFPVLAVISIIVLFVVCMVIDMLKSRYISGNIHRVIKRN